MIQRDQKIIWHPYSQHGLNQSLIPVKSAQGAYLELEDGRRVIDAISSWWVNIHGHSHPRIVRAIEAQAAQLDHVIFSGFTHEPAIRLAELILDYPAIKTRGLQKVFYSDNGSTAVEVALKMAYQYHYNRGDRSRIRFIALKGSYHGDTLGAMAVSEPEGFHRLFRPLLPHVDFVEPGDLCQLESLLKSEGHRYAGFIFEPMLQGAAGMKLVDRDFLERATELCRSYEILNIADEVFTGFYRTGKCFAVEHTQIQPDLMCLSKGITGGFLPLSVTLTSEEIYSAFWSTEMRTAFLHGHSYTANPISCAAAIESWDLLQSHECKFQVELISMETEAQIARLKSHPKVKSARCIGTIGAIEIKSAANYFSMNSSTILKFSVDRKVLLRPLGNVLYAVPPYCCRLEEIQRIYGVMTEVLDELF